MDRRQGLVLALAIAGILGSARMAVAEPPLAIFHAFDQRYADVESFVCDLALQGYSHVQIAPAQKSNPDEHWWGRYQPVDYSVIEGKGSEADLKRLIKKAHGCGIKVIADVVFNHMASMDAYRDLDFPGISKTSFHPKCDINYNDGKRDTEVDCWLGGLPDLDQSKPLVEAAQKAHLKRMLKLGADGFRFDAAKHIPAAVLKKYVDFLDKESRGKAWNYLEVVEDNDTKGEEYLGVGAVTDFVLYRSLKAAFVPGGDLRSLRAPNAIDDPHCVTFGQSHDTIRELNGQAIDPYTDRTDAFLATAFVLAREAGTPLVLNWDSYDNPFIKYGIKFRQIMAQRRQPGGNNVRESLLAIIDSPTVLVMERGSEGFFVVNKATAKLDVKTMDVTLTHLEGCYRELRSNFNVAVERREDKKKLITRWGTWSRGGMEIQARDALFFVREPWSQCQAR